MEQISLSPFLLNKLDELVKILLEKIILGFMKIQKNM